MRIVIWLISGLVALLSLGVFYLLTVKTLGFDNDPLVMTAYFWLTWSTIGGIVNHEYRYHGL